MILTTWALNDFDIFDGFDNFDDFDDFDHFNDFDNFDDFDNFGDFDEFDNCDKGTNFGDFDGLTMLMIFMIPIIQEIVFHQTDHHPKSILCTLTQQNFKHTLWCVLQTYYVDIQNQILI